MSNANRKSSTKKGGKSSRISPFSTEEDITNTDSGYTEDTHDTPMVMATVISSPSFPRSSSKEKLATKSLSNPMKASFRDKSSTFLYEPPPEDTLPPPVNIWPEALRQRVRNKLSKQPNIEAGKSFLTKNGWPSGLQEAVIKSCRKIPVRFYIVDDSGSMISNDGRRVMTHGGKSRLIGCTRWAELSGSVLFLAELSESFEVISEFRLVNGADPAIVGLEREGGVDTSLSFLRDAMSESPAGPTPLCAHIQAIVSNIEAIADILRERNQRAVVVIATDGESTDGDVAQALKPLIHLPVMVIVRLCTEEKTIIDYWNSIDQQLELDVDVLDDQLGDARQVAVANGWLTYAEPLHRLREFGASMKELDIIDEKTVSMEQMRLLVAYM